MPVLTGLDVVGIQGFVFGSNRLRDVVGASWLVDWATARAIGDGESEGALAALADEQTLLAAGGNAVLKFESLDQAKKYSARYSRRVFDDAQGVEVVIAHREFKPGELAKALRALQVDLARAKLERRPNVPLLGLSVTASCANTGLPAIDFDPRNRLRPLSRQALQTGDRNLAKSSTERWRRLLPVGRADLDRFDFPLELDDLGSSRGERSLLGVVHIDGNSIGSRIRNWLDHHVKETKDDCLVEVQYREWSKALKTLGDTALQAVLNRIFNAIQPRKSTDGKLSPFLTCGREYAADDGAEPRDLSFELRAVTEKERKQYGWRHDWWLPIRPILLGGDDLTFLCDGRIALDLAATALHKMEELAKSVPHLDADKKPITACAGVAIVPHHAPFVRSYELAEALCQSAKRKSRAMEQNGQHASCIDWHVGLPKPGLSVRDVREREYAIVGDNGHTQSLTCRPYAIVPLDPENCELSWHWLDETLLDDAKAGLRASKVWNGRRNKVKELREVLRSGPKADEAVTAAIQRWQVVTPGLGLPSPINKDGGFLDRNRTPLLDALELLDLHLPLGPIAAAPTQETTP